MPFSTWCWPCDPQPGLAWSGLCDRRLQLDTGSQKLASPPQDQPEALTCSAAQAVLENTDLLTSVMQHLGALDSTRFRVRPHPTTQPNTCALALN